jgi:hypothetical protein
MTDTERISALEGELATLKSRMDTEKAERLALQQIVIGPLNEVRQNLELHVDFLTGRLEELRSRPRAGSGSEADADVADDIAEIFTGMINLLKLVNRLDERLDWLSGAFMRDQQRQARAMGIEA